MSSSQDASTGAITSSDVACAAAFLRDQSEDLIRGLSDPAAPGLLRRVLDQHDEQHRAWLDLLGRVERWNPSAAALLADLYVQHGRSAGALERFAHSSLPAVLRRKVLTVHARELQARTAAVIAALLALPAGPAQEARQEV